MSKITEKLLNEPMDRAAFLKLLLVATLSLVGVTRLIEALKSGHVSASKTYEKADNGYGVTPYGK